jgi:hypothetical protein
MNASTIRVVITITSTRTLNSLGLLLAVARESNAVRCSTIFIIVELVRKDILDLILIVTRNQKNFECMRGKKGRWEMFGHSRHAHNTRNGTMHADKDPRCTLPLTHTSYLYLVLDCSGTRSPVRRRRVVLYIVHLCYPYFYDLSLYIYKLVGIILIYEYHAFMNKPTWWMMIHIIGKPGKIPHITACPCVYTRQFALYRYKSRAYGSTMTIYI